MDGTVAVIDLNSDLGEVWRGAPTADDDAMFRIVTSANIACGFHAGTEVSMRESVQRAAEHGVALGAHPSYRDEAGFGRRAMEIPPAVLEADVLEQLLALERAVQTVEAADRDGITIRRPAPIAYVKPHGALYNRIALDRVQAAAVVRAVVAFGDEHGRMLPVLGLAGTAIEQQAREAGLRFVSEAFVDRGYLADGSLVPRGVPGAVITDHAAAVRRAVSMVVEGQVATVDGSVIDVTPASLCVHGDTPGSVELAQALRAALIDAGVRLAAPWGARRS